MKQQRCCRRKKTSKISLFFPRSSIISDDDAASRRGAAPAAPAGLPLVPSFEVNELISIDKYLRSAGLLLRQVRRRERKRKR